MSKISIDIDKIVKASLRGAIPAPLHEEPRRRNVVTEAYVADPKTFKQVSDDVSQRAKDEHIALYKGYVDSLNKVSAALDSVDREDTNPRHSRFRTLKVDETNNLNATWLHELYFANCFDPNSEIYADSMPYIRLQRDFGTFEDWQHDMIACAMSANEGWAVTGYHMFLKRFINTTIDLHAQNVMVGLYPVIVLDCWGHAYYRDFVSDRKSFILSQMKELSWDVITERFERVEKLAAALR